MPTELIRYSVRKSDTEYVIPETVTRIHAPLKSIGTENVGAEVFYDMPSLHTCYVDAENTVYASEDGVLFKAGTLFAYPQAKTDAYYAIFNGTNAVAMHALESIGMFGFRNAAALNEMVIFNTVTFIGLGAFIYTDLFERIVIPKSVETMAPDLLPRLLVLFILKHRRYLRDTIINGMLMIQM